MSTYIYSPFRKLIIEQEQVKLNIGFNTKYEDESGLIYYNNRYYDSELGRFISQDPIFEEGGVNLYNFVENDPINHWDILGFLNVGESEVINKKSVTLSYNFPIPSPGINLANNASISVTGEVGDCRTLESSTVNAMGETVEVYSIVENGFSSLSLSGSYTFDVGINIADFFILENSSTTQGLVLSLANFTASAGGSISNGCTEDLHYNVGSLSGSVGVRFSVGNFSVNGVAGLSLEYGYSTIGGSSFSIDFDYDVSANVDIGFWEFNFGFSNTINIFTSRDSGSVPTAPNPSDSILPNNITMETNIVPPSMPPILSL